MNPNGQLGLDPLTLTKFILWIATAVVATVFLARRKMTTRTRLAFVIGGVVIFGFAYGALLAPGLNPNPVASVRTLLKGLLVQKQVLIPVAGMLAVMLAITVISNKAFCGYNCQLGLLQDLLHRVPVRKWHPSFKLTNTIRVIAFVALVAGLVLSGLDWIGVIDPFQLFQFNLTVPILLALVIVLASSVVIYRPWCRFLCPFGLLSWGAEQVSVMRPRIDRDLCKGCQACVKACPSGAMKDFYEGKAIHADCFACGACIEACKVKDALVWRGKNPQSKA